MSICFRRDGTQWIGTGTIDGSIYFFAMRCVSPSLGAAGYVLDVLPQDGRNPFEIMASGISTCTPPRIVFDLGEIVPGAEITLTDDASCCLTPAPTDCELLVFTPYQVRVTATWADGSCSDCALLNDVVLTQSEGNACFWGNTLIAMCGGTWRVSMGLTGSSQPTITFTDQLFETATYGASSGPVWDGLATLTIPLAISGMSKCVPPVSVTLEPI